MVTRIALISSFAVGGVLGAAFLPASRGGPAAEPDPGPAPAQVHAPDPDPDERDLLGPLLAIPPDSAARRLGTAELRRALALGQAGDAAGAVAAYERSIEVFPQFADWAHVLAAGAAARAGDTATAQRMLARAGPVLAEEWGWRARVAALRNAGDRAGAARAAEAAAARHTSAARRAEAWKLLGEIRLEQGDTAAAAGAFRQAIEVAPLASHAVDAARTLSMLPGLTPHDHLAIGRLYLRHGNLIRGADGIQTYLAAGPGEAGTRAEARLELGRAHFRVRAYAEAEQVLLPLASEAPRALAAEALFLAGRARFRQGREAQARATFEEVVERFPAEAPAAEALYILADLDHDEGRIDAARRRYARVLELRPEGEAAARSAMRSGGLLYLAGDYRGAGAVFDRYRVSHPRGEAYEQATYWSARAYLKAGDRVLAEERLREVLRVNPAGYYGMRASDLLGAAAWHASLAPAPVTSPEADREVRGALVRLDVLRDLGLSEAPAYEMERLKRYFAATPGALYALAEAFNARGEIFTAIRLGREIQRREGTWNERVLRIIYPFPHRETILAEARRNGLDPYLVAGLIRQESMFNERAVSPAGAIGLMQVMPTTARRLARMAGMKTVREADLKRPEVNVKLGTIFLADLLGNYGGKVPDALAAYNAGPTRMVRWRNFQEYRDQDLFAERIPFEETREYVKVVQQNARIYRDLYGDAGAVAD